MVKKVVVVILVIGLLICGTLGWAAINQPHTMAALEALKKAKMELEAAEHNKSVYRVKAIELVNKAIKQTKKSIEVSEKEQ